ncbi:MAG: hypothetical protein OEM58_10070, partial [Nitrospirota bacterium]|nr:hypothetical protein [Nitrospirota bacterium]
EHFLGKNDETQSRQTGQKRGKQLKKYVPIEKSDQGLRQHKLGGRDAKCRLTIVITHSHFQKYPVKSV